MEELKMNLQQVKALGITSLSDEDAKKVADASAEELKTYISKTKFDEVNSSKKELEKQVKERDMQLEEAKKNTGDNEELKRQLEEAQNTNKENQKKYEADLKEMQISNAIKLAIADKAQDVDLVSSLFDKSKLILGDDGKVTGLNEQLKTLQESKNFLFKPVEENTDSKPQSGFKFGNTNPNPKPEPGQRATMHDAIAARLQGQLGQ